MTVFLFAVFSEGNRWRILLFITQETAHVSRACDDDKLIQARKDKERHIKEHDYSKYACRQLTLEQCLSNTGMLMLLLHVMMTNESKHTNVFINVTNMKYINLNLSREGEGRAGGRCLPIN